VCWCKSPLLQFMRYAQGGGLTDRQMAVREPIRLQPVELFARGEEQQVAEASGVTEQPVERWRRAWREREARPKSPRSDRLTSAAREGRIARLDRELERGPPAHGWADQRWTPTRIRTLIGRLFHVSYTVEAPGGFCVLDRAEDQTGLRIKGNTCLQTRFAEADCRSCPDRARCS
jgi:hypothetical protein